MRLPQVLIALEDMIYRGRTGEYRFPRSQWAYDEGFQAYLRVGRRLVMGEWGRWITAANFSADQRRTGLMREMFEICEEQAAKHQLDGVLVESLLNLEIRPFLIARGYQPTRAGDPYNEGYGDYVRHVGTVLGEDRS